MKRRAAILAAGMLAAAPLLAVAPSAQAAVSCSVDYTASSWSGGFVGNLTIHNSADALSAWTLTFTFGDAGQKVTQGWSANWSQSGSTVTATNMSWNGSVPTGGTVGIGFIGSWTSANPAPTGFAINGTSCGGTGTPTTTTTTTRPTTTTTTTRPTTTTTTTRPTTTTTTRPTTTTTTTSQSSGAAPALHVSGNKLVTASGATYRLLGVNRSSGEFACVQGKGVWDGPSDQAMIDGLKTWNIHAIRLPLNEQCWLGTYGSPSGAEYQQSVKDYVNLLVANGLNVVLDLHWSYGSINSAYNGNCTDVNATCQKPMPDAQYAPQFWTGVANAFKGNNAVLFDLFNEPWPDGANEWRDSTAAWTCLRDGGTCAGIGYQVAGMQSLVNAVRSTGATNVILTGGLSWTNDLSQWLQYKPTDSTGNLMASWHTYNFNACVTSSCWNSTIGTVAAQVPVQAGEIGQDTCAHDYVDQVMAWADANGIGYTAWTWNPWGVCSSQGNDLITDWNGTPTSTFGEGIKAHLATVNP